MACGTRPATAALRVGLDYNRAMVAQSGSTLFAMTKSLALVGVAAMTLSAGCAHECRCVCVDNAGRAIAAAPRARAFGGSDLDGRYRARRFSVAYPSPFATRSDDGHVRSRMRLYPDPFELTTRKADPFESFEHKSDPFESPRKATTLEADPYRVDPSEGRRGFEAAEALEEADSAAVDRAASQPEREAEAAAGAERLRQQLQRITRP